jgi:hypothetical protein
MRLEHLHQIFAQFGPITYVDHLVLAVGINNRSQNFYATTKKNAEKALSIMRRSFPSAKVHFVEILNNQLEREEMENMRSITNIMRRRGASILKSPRDLHTNHDGIHWTQESADRLVDSWLDQLN